MFAVRSPESEAAVDCHGRQDFFPMTCHTLAEGECLLSVFPSSSLYVIRFQVFIQRLLYVIVWQMTMNTNLWDGLRDADIRFLLGKRMDALLYLRCYELFYSIWMLDWEWYTFLRNFLSILYDFQLGKEIDESHVSCSTIQGPFGRYLSQERQRHLKSSIFLLPVPACTTLRVRGQRGSLCGYDLQWDRFVCFETTKYLQLGR